MKIQCLELEVLYDLKKDKFEMRGDVNQDGARELVETFLRGQIGAGKDKGEPAKRKVYAIQLRWYPTDDRIEVNSNTGNKSLRDGLLLNYLRSLN
jgi:hypothetical protein